MGETVRNLTFLIWAFCAMNSESVAQEGYSVISDEQGAFPTMVYAVSQKPDGEKDGILLEQPESASNPLGDPLTIPNNSAVSDEQPSEEQIEQNSSSTSEQATLSAGRKTLPSKDLGKDFQNTLLEANGMVYDVQAYPVEDLKAIGDSANPQTIYSPNVNP